ncbi:SMI1/KNR4 family protein [Streptomyces sp. NPDC018031]|uniref:SMI1/KNR4 family protein n=1 Tax=Streptomyces sp. NPDC018031 TaxID=3365033 RepID=UPI0037B3ABE1
MHSPITRSWQRIENWLGARGRIRELAAPATREDIAGAEERLGSALPAEHAELLRCHNGGGSFTLPPYYEILGTTELVTAWETKTRVWSQDRYRPYDPRWVPFASDRAGGVLYLDAGPHGDRRVRGHDREGGSDLTTSHPMWGSLTSLMRHTAEALENGGDLDGYQRPGEEDAFLLWGHYDDEPSRWG